ncbi:MAG: hypothetical protein AAGH64_04325 [Planctomycetota bacterium]
MDDDTRDELQRMQEAQGHTDHQVDQLDEQVREAFDRLQRLTARLDALEGRLNTLAAAGEVKLVGGAIDEDAPEFERPPHSSRARPNDD